MNKERIKEIYLNAYQEGQWWLRQYLLEKYDLSRALIEGTLIDTDTEYGVVTPNMVENKGEIIL